MSAEKPEPTPGPAENGGQARRRKPASPTFAQRLSAMIRRKSNALEVLRELRKAMNQTRARSEDQTRISAGSWTP